jgi:O-acetyl-ADP-ribose deacetylase (regulator of RNase III)
MASSSRQKIIFRSGDLLCSNAEYIAHQCNTRTKRGKNLSKAVFDAFPHANVYARRHAAGQTSSVGEIEICGGRVDETFHHHHQQPAPSSTAGDQPPPPRGVINMFAQRYPSFSKWGNDTTKQRFEWFRQCLREIKRKIPDLSSIAFPARVGCGCAGGDWDAYLGAITEWSNAWTDGPTVYIIALGPEQSGGQQTTLDAFVTGGGR